MHLHPCASHIKELFSTASRTLPIIRRFKSQIVSIRELIDFSAAHSSSSAVCAMDRVLVLAALAVTTVHCLNDTSDDVAELAPQPFQASDNPCNCYFKDSCGCICSRPISWAQFQVLPQNFRPCRGFTLGLRGGQFHSFPSDYFYRVGHVKDFVLDVGSVNFQYLNDPDGESSPYNGVTFDVSTYIRMYGVSVSRTWNWGALYWLAPSSTSAYCEIQIVQSTVPLIQADFGRICQGAVTVVNVMSSGTVAVENRAFAPFFKLVELNLSNNRLQEMRRSFFSYPANSLEVIDLSNNNIRALPRDIFSQMPKLQSVNIRGNPLTNLDERTFRPIFRTVEIVGLDSELNQSKEKHLRKDAKEI